MNGLSGINWTQILTLLISTSVPAFIALRSIRQSHNLTLERDAQAHKRQRELQQDNDERLRRRERHFISTELIFILEAFAVECASVALDKGIPRELPAKGKQEVLIPSCEVPEISFGNVAGDWRTLNERDMFRTREIPVMLQDALVRIINHTDHLSYGMDSHAILQIRGESVAPAGLRAASVARKLRRQCGFPSSPLSEGDFSAVRTLQKVRMRCIRNVIRSKCSINSEEYNL
ncbi:hypothetical protein [Pantoea sp. S62]|uniref:hypothetical protein n=1 Tax=Pantoea sp. S62 TaxID=2769342 RepID=UPI001914861E|nr:hypothetical protein [Pantoea sp. S62]MBK5017266.1 hypothetical protein [Pantoea sp. S62]